MLDAHTFRQVYPAFADLTVFSPAAIDYWLASAANRLASDRWGSQWEEGVGLLAAHSLAIAAGSAGGGVTGAPISSKSVGGVSVAYNYEVGAMEGAGSYNLTTYGKEFIRIARVVGMGVVQL